MIADFLICLPIFNTVNGYRVPHLLHHRTSGTTDDPYHFLYATGAGRARILLGMLSDLCGVTAFLSFVGRYFGRGTQKTRQPLYAAPGLLLVQASIGFGLYLLTGAWWSWFVLWLIPLLTIPILINRIRTITEHAVANGSVDANRTTLVGVFEYLLIAPYGYAHHFEHHRMPTIPYYRLRWAHRRLLEQGIAFSPDELAGAGYLRTAWRLIVGNG